jgi:hypothetical protein
MKKQAKAKAKPAGLKRNGKTLYGAAAQRVLQKEEAERKAREQRKRAKARANGGRLNPDDETAEKLADAYQDFSGAPPSQLTQINVEAWQPRELWKLGDFCELHLTTPDGQAILIEAEGDFPPILAADARNRLQIVNFQLSLAEVERIAGGLQLADLSALTSNAITYQTEAAQYKIPQSAIVLGWATHITYGALKMHLHPRWTRWIHKFGEEGGARPIALSIAGKPALLGGDYTIGSPGIID